MDRIISHTQNRSTYPWPGVSGRLVLTALRHSMVRGLGSQKQLELPISQTCIMKMRKSMTS